MSRREIAGSARASLPVELQLDPMLISEDRPLVFMHNYRSGGTVVNLRLLEFTQPGGHPLAYLEHPVFKFGMLDGIDYQWPDFFEEAGRGRKRYFIGHLCFGVHDHMERPASYATNIRRSRDRLLSGFKKYWQGESDPKDWLLGHWETDNGITKRLAGIDVLDGAAYDFVEDWPICPAAEFVVDDAIYERARVTVERHLHAVVFYERFVPSMVLFERRFGLPPLFSFHKQYINRSEDNGVALDEPFLQRIDALNRYDTAIYEMCLADFEARMATAPEDVLSEIAVREAIDQMLKHHKSTGLTDDEVISAVKRHFIELTERDDVDLVQEIAVRLLRHPVLNEDMREAIMRSARACLSKSRFGDVLRRSAEPARLP